MVITDYDICLEIGEKSIEVAKIHSGAAAYISQPNYTIDSVKSIKQILKHSINFESFANQHTKIYFKKKFLVLEYFIGSCITN